MAHRLDGVQITRSTIAVPPFQHAVLRHRSRLGIRDVLHKIGVTGAGRTQIAPEEANHSFARDRFRLDFSRGDGVLALHLEEPDNAEVDRIWNCDFSLERSTQRVTFSTRLIFRQPQTLNRFPASRAPRLLGDIVSRAKVSDVWELSTSARTISPSDIPLVEELIDSASRTLPVILISEDVQRGPIINVTAVARLLAGTAHVLHLTPDSSWTLTRDWGADWSCYGGGVRCYNAGTDRQRNFYIDDIGIRSGTINV